MQRRGRSLSVFGMLIAGAIGTIGSTQTWITVVRADAGEDLLVAGASAVPLLSPLALAVLALGAALSLVGRIFRYVFAALALAIAVVLWIPTLNIVINPPLSAVTSTVTEATGLAGDTALRSIVGEMSTTAWPVLSLVAWTLLAVSAVLCAATAHLWQKSGRRFDTSMAVASDGPVDAIDSWDELSRGSDPTR